jgi:predicted enzyme related to lactoylglutathione lyase
MPSNFFWYELMTSDLDAAEAFYKNVIGWKSERWGGDFPYAIMKPEGSEQGVAGLMTIHGEAAAAGAKPMWLGYIHAKDVDAATESVRKAGGQVKREPSDIPEVGRFSVVADPQGVMFMLMTPQGPDTPPAPPGTMGHVGWHELYTTDWQAALDFYSSQFGWTKDQSLDMGAMGTYQLFAVEGQQAGGMMNKPSQMPMPFWLFYFNVSDINAAADRVKANGGTVIMGPMEVPGGSWIIQAQDPQGAMFALVTPAG